MTSSISNSSNLAEKGGCWDVIADHFFSHSRDGIKENTLRNIAMEKPLF